MPDSLAQNADINKTGINRDGMRGIARETAHNFLHLAILLISAGKIGWANAWVCIGLGLLYLAINTAVLNKFNPQVLNRRGRLIQETTKRFDKVFIAFYIPLALVTSIIAGLDAVRYGWSDMPFGVIISGAAILILACILGSWAMAVNPHFETTVIVREKDQQVCASGPYKIVRHPGYAAAIIGAFSYPLILGSWWGLAPVAALSVLFVIRTALEDGTLLKELPGYKEYANVTRHRLIPLVW